MTTFTQKPFLNAGCGRIILPAPKPPHHGLIDDAIYAYPLWLNADRNAGPGVDSVVDLFRYPWPWADNSFDGALLAHIVEHIPHEIRLSTDDGIPKWMAARFMSADVFAVRGRAEDLAAMQDGWYAFMSELHRVLTPGAVAHVLAPYGWSQGAITDPTHTRLITEHTFTHQLAPEPDAPFAYATGGLHFELVDQARFNLTPFFAHLRERPEMLQQALATQINVVYDIAVRLRAIK